MLHEERRRAESFGEDADGYERTRPSYPRALVEGLVARPGLEVLDVGCGTGKASRLFQEAGCSVLGVELDGRMARVARGRGLEVELGRFETWPDRGRRFDLLVSGQAWHWVEPARGVARAGQLLRLGGQLAPFWNTRLSDPPEVRERLAACYQRHAPELAHSSMARGSAGSATVPPEHLAALSADDRFGPPELRRYPWARCYTAREWHDLLGTHSDHRLLPEARRKALLDAVEEAVEDLGGELAVAYETVVVVAQRAR